MPKENHWSKTHDKFPVTLALPVAWKTSTISVSAIRTFTRSNHTLPDIFLLTCSAFIKTQYTCNAPIWFFSWLPYFSHWCPLSKLNSPNRNNDFSLINIYMKSAKPVCFDISQIKTLLFGFLCLHGYLVFTTVSKVSWLVSLSLLFFPVQSHSYMNMPRVVMQLYRTF